MKDREKVIKGLECCASMDGHACAECPYSSECVSGEAEYQVGTAHLASDALALLKEQETTYWTSVKDRKPDNSNHVLARCEIQGLNKPKSYTCVAFYAKKNSVSVGCFDDDICCEYDEETDEYYLKEGWYEVIHNWDEYGSVAIHDIVTHWALSPEPPKEESDA